MSQIKITNLTFCYEGSYDTIFEKVSFQMDTNWKLGLTGRNGRGKTTLLRLLMGEYPYDGTIVSDAVFDYFPYEVQSKENLTMFVIDEINEAYQFWQLQKELSLLEVEEEVLYRPFHTLSQGEQAKVLLAALFLKEGNFLLIDEPTNHLDYHGRTVMQAYLKSKKGFILVSHDRNFLDGCIDHILSINKADIEVQKGNFSTWKVNREQQEQFEEAENAKLEKEIGKLKQSARQTATWSHQIEKTKNGQRVAGLRPDRGHIGHQAAKMMKRSKATEKRRKDAINKKQRLLKNREFAAPLKIEGLSHHAKRLVTVDGVSICYEKEICSPVSFVVEQGDRIAVRGKNGAGKSSLLKLIQGEQIPHTGQIIKVNNLVISFVSQNTDGLVGNLRDYAKDNCADETLLKAILVKLDFSQIQFEKNMADYSQGQKKKVLIAVSLCTKAHLYIWDEPLNYIDVISRMQIEQLILESQPTILFVEHDEQFVEHTATKIVQIE